MPMFTNEHYSEQQKQVTFKKVRPSKRRAMGGAGGNGQHQVHQITFSSYSAYLSGNLRFLLLRYLPFLFSCCQMKLVLRNGSWTAAAAVLGTDAIKDSVPVVMREGEFGITGFNSQRQRELRPFFL